MHDDSEDALVEQPTIAPIRDTLGWETLGAEHTFFAQVS